VVKRLETARLRHMPVSDEEAKVQRQLDELQQTLDRPNQVRVWALAHCFCPRP
jgi:hypothetical protein